MLTPCLSYTIDSTTKIVDVGGEWNEFAFKNEAFQLSSENVIGKSLWKFIENPTVHHVFQKLFAKIRQSGQSKSFPFRCDSPNERRFLTMVLQPFPADFIQIQTFYVQNENREYLTFIDKKTTHTKDFVIMCSWCNKIEVDKQWYEIEIGIGHLQMFDKLEPPAISHGICPFCSKILLTELQTD